MLIAAGILAVFAGCTAEIELAGSGNNAGTLPLRPGEQELSIRLNGITDVSGVPATRAAELVTVAGENEIQSITIYGMVGLSKGAVPDVTVTDGYAVDNPTAIRDYTLERTYRYVPGSNDNDLLLVSDGSGYMLSLAVQNDSYARMFIVAVNTEEKTNEDAVAPPVAVPVYTDATKATLSDRSGASTGANILSILHGVRIGAEYGLETDVMSVEPPLAMAGIACQSIQSSTGENRITYYFLQDSFDRGMSVELVRSVARFDVRLPEYVKLVGLFPVKTGGNTNQGMIEPVVDATSWQELDERIYRREISVRYAALNATVPVNNMVSGAFYLPAGRLYDDRGGQVKLKVEYLGKEVDLTVFEPGAVISRNTRYIVNVVNSGANTLSASLRVAEWNTAGNEIDAGDLYGTLNTGATAEVEVVRMRDGNMDGIFETETILTGAQALLYGEIDTGTKKVFVTHTVGQQSGNSKYEVFVKLTGTAGDTKPVGISDPDGLLDWTRKTEDTSTGTYTVKVPFAASTTPIATFTPPRTSVLKVLTHPASGEEKGEEYTVTKDYVTPGALTDPRAADMFGAVDIITSNDRWSVDETTKTITLPVLTEYESLKLSEAGLYSGYMMAGLGDWLTATYTSQNLKYGTPSFIAITPVDNFKSDKPRTGELILRQWNGTAVENTTYKIVQPGGNFDALLLSNGGFGVDISPTTNGGDLVEGVAYNNKKLTCPQGGLSSNPIAYNICIYSNNSEPIFVEIIQGSSWMSLEAKIIGGRVTPLEGKYAIGLRLAEDGVAGTIRNGKVAVSYRDAATGSLKTEIINVTQGFGR